MYIFQFSVVNRFLSDFNWPPLDFSDGAFLKLLIPKEYLSLPLSRIVWCFLRFYVPIAA